MSSILRGSDNFDTATPLAKGGPVNSQMTVSGYALNLASGQITFPSTQNASSDANTLDDYEEGTWTPTITASSSNPSVGYTTQAGRYTKIGRFVLLNIDIRWSSFSGGSGNTFIANLPFTSGDRYSTAAVAEHSSSIPYGYGKTTLAMETAGYNVIPWLGTGSGQATGGIDASSIANQAGYIIFSIAMYV